MKRFAFVTVVTFWEVVHWAGNASKSHLIFAVSTYDSKLKLKLKLKFTWGKWGKIFIKLLQKNCWVFHHFIVEIRQMKIMCKEFADPQL